MKKRKEKSLNAAINELSREAMTVFSCGEMATSKGVYHKNNAARKVSRLSKAVNGMA